MSKLEDLGIKLIQFLFGAEHMQYMMLLSVAANLKQEIFGSLIFSVYAVIKALKDVRQLPFSLLQWKMHDDEVC